MAIQGIQKGLRFRGTQQVGIQLDGQWREFDYLVNNVDTLLTKAAIAGQRAFAKKYQAAVKTNIRNGGKRFHYPTLSVRYKAFKERHGGSAGLLMWSKAMHDNVIVKDLGLGKVGVGIEKGIKRDFYDSENPNGNRLSISEYANILEHGSFPMPARPVFSDTFKSEQVGGLNGIRKAIELSIITTYTSKGIPVTKQ